MKKSENLAIKNHFNNKIWKFRNLIPSQGLLKILLINLKTKKRKMNKRRQKSILIKNIAIKIMKKDGYKNPSSIIQNYIKS